MVSETVTWCKYKKLPMRSKIETTQLVGPLFYFSLFTCLEVTLEVSLYL
jgi:hypothetical protein